MAENSRFCKAICITVLSAILVIVDDANPGFFFVVSVFVVFMFWQLDSRNLDFEREYRSTYNKFVKMLHSGEEEFVSQLYIVPLPRADKLKSLKAMFSFSTFWFYLFIFVVMAIIFMFLWLRIQQ